MTTLALQVTNNNDNFFQNGNGGGVSNPTTAVVMGFGNSSSGSDYACAYFRNVTIPPFAGIDSAVFSLFISTTADTIDGKVFVNNRIPTIVVRAGISSDVIRGLKQISDADPFVQWGTAGGGTAPTLGAYNTVDIAPIVQHQISRPDWFSGNDLLVIWHHNDFFNTFEWDPYALNPTNPPKLTINFTANRYTYLTADNG